MASLSTSITYHLFRALSLISEGTYSSPHPHLWLSPGKTLSIFKEKFLLFLELRVSSGRWKDHLWLQVQRFQAPRERGKQPVCFPGNLYPAWTNQAVEILHANRVSLYGITQVHCLLPVAATSQLTSKASSPREFSMSSLHPTSEHICIKVTERGHIACWLYIRPLVGSLYVGDTPPHIQNLAICHFHLPLPCSPKRGQQIRLTCSW